MLVCELRSNTAAGGSLEKSNLKEIWLVNILDGVHFFAEHRGNRIHADRSAAESFDNCAQQLPIDVIKPVFIDVEKLQRVASYRRCDFACSLHLRVIPDSL